MRATRRRSLTMHRSRRFLEHEPCEICIMGSKTRIGGNLCCGTSWPSRRQSHSRVWTTPHGCADDVQGMGTRRAANGTEASEGRESDLPWLASELHRRRPQPRLLFLRSRNRCRSGWPATAPGGGSHAVSRQAPSRSVHRAPVANPAACSPRLARRLFARRSRAPSGRPSRPS